MKSSAIEVCAAVVLTGDRLLLATRRPGAHLSGKWEFPGGKIRADEDACQCISREMNEELGVHAGEWTELFALEYEYPEKAVRLHFMFCQDADGVTANPAEGQKCGWFTAAEALALDLAPADRKALELLKDASCGNLHDELAKLDLTAAAKLLDFMKKGDAMEGGRLPEWLRFSFVGGRERLGVQGLIKEGGLHTVCESAKCPNRCDCWKRKTATFMILGDTCTRFCRFCAVNHGHPQAPDPEEPVKIADSAASLGLKYVVITCVTRDDLPDGGAAAMAAAVNAIRERTPQTKVEVLCSDYGGDMACVDTVLASRPAVFGHNVETVERLTPAIRNKADYRRSLAVLEHASANAGKYGAIAKSGIMLGLGETEEEIRRTLQDLRLAGVSMITIGQYLRPTRKHWPVSRLVTPGEFDRWRKIAEEEIGFVRAVAGPFVRSSYMAEEAFDACGQSAEMK